MKHKEGDIVLYEDRYFNGEVGELLYKLIRAKNKKDFFWNFIKTQTPKTSFMKPYAPVMFYYSLSKISFYYTTKSRRLLIEKKPNFLI